MATLQCYAPDLPTVDVRRESSERARGWYCGILAICALLVSSFSFFGCKIGFEHQLHCILR